MVERLDNLTDQLSESQKEYLVGYLRKHFALDFTGEIMRDDIRDRIFEMIKLLFGDDKMIVGENSSFIDLEIDATDVSELHDKIESEFIIRKIEFSEAMEWQKIKDVIDCVEDRLID